MEPQEGGTEEEHVFKRLWKQMVQAAKNIAKKIKKEIAGDENQQPEYRPEN